MLVYYKVLQGVHGQEIAQNVFRGIIIDPPDPAKLADIDMGMIIQINKRSTGLLIFNKVPSGLCFFCQASTNTSFAKIFSSATLM